MPSGDHWGAGQGTLPARRSFPPQLRTCQTQCSYVSEPPDSLSVQAGRELLAAAGRCPMNEMEVYPLTASRQRDIWWKVSNLRKKREV